MLHGGLRYLEHGQFALVREALVERGARLAHGARAGAPGALRGAGATAATARRAWKLRIGLTLYDLLAGRGAPSPHAMAQRARRAARSSPRSRATGCVGAGIYSDVVMDDARLAVAVARDAAAHGADDPHAHRAGLGAARSRAARVEVDRARSRRAAKSARSPRARSSTPPARGATPRAATCARMLRPGAPTRRRGCGPRAARTWSIPALTRGHGIVARARRRRPRVLRGALRRAGRSWAPPRSRRASPPPERRRPPDAGRSALPAARDWRACCPACATCAPIAVFAGRASAAALGAATSAAPRANTACSPSGRS